MDLTVSSNTNIDNYSDVSVQSVSGGLSTDMGNLAMAGMAAAMSALGNVNKDDSATTQSAVSQNINLDVREGEIPTALSRDTAGANQRVEQFDKQEYQERLEAAQVIGDIAKNAVNVATYEERTKSAKLKDLAKDAEKAENHALAAALSEQAAVLDKKIDARFGLGSPNGQAIAAVTVVLQGLAGGNAAQAITGGLSPYVNSQIKELTGDNTEANLVAHALWGAIEAQASGNSALAGATAAASGEVVAAFLTEQLYGKAPKDLTASEKETISGLSQIVGALSSVAVANNSSDGYRGAEVAKSAVENNSLSGDEFRRKLEEDKERYKQKVRDELGNNTASQLINGVINVIAETGDFGVLALDGAFDASAALITCAIGDSYCGQAKKDLASKNQGAVDALNSLMNGDSWNAIKSMANNAYYGDQTALENLSGILTGIAIPIKNLPKGVSANEKLPVVDKTVGYPITEFNHQAHNAAIYEALKLDLKTQQAANHLIDSLKNTGKLPDNFITKIEAEKLGWKAGKKPVPDGKIIGGEPYSNAEGLLPSAPERKWFEADINYTGTKSRGKERLYYSDDGLLYFTRDHQTLIPMGSWK